MPGVRAAGRVVPVDRGAVVVVGALSVLCGAAAVAQRIGGQRARRADPVGHRDVDAGTAVARLDRQRERLREIDRRVVAIAIREREVLAGDLAAEVAALVHHGAAALDVPRDAVAGQVRDAGIVAAVLRAQIAALDPPRQRGRPGLPQGTRFTHRCELKLAAEQFLPSQPWQAWR